MHGSTVTKTTTLALAATALLAALPMAFGHGYIVEPAAVWKQGYPSNGYGQTVDNLLWGEMDGATYGYGPSGAVKYFEANFAKSSYKSLQDLILAKQVVLTEYKSDAQCGLTTKDEAKRAELPSTLKYSGFTHAGPCEVWCDNTKLAYALDCQATYADGNVPIDTAKCAGADRLTVYWIGVHGAPWQVYTDCVYLKGSSGGGSPAVTPAGAPVPAVTSKAPAPAATTKAPVATTKTPVAADATPKPAATTVAPSKNCVRRNRQ